MHGARWLTPAGTFVLTFGMNRIDNITFWIFIGFWPLWFIWEMAILIMRGKGLHVDTISMEARDRAYQMNSMVFAWCGLAAHFWFNWYNTRTWSTPIPAIIFWLMVAATLALDIALLNRPYETLPQWLQWYRWPLIQASLGLLAGYLLFPQKGKLP